MGTRVADVERVPVAHGQGQGDEEGQGAPAHGLLINRDFALLWSGQTVSTLGDVVFSTTLVLWIATGIGRGQAWAPLAVSGVLIATAIPSLVVGPLAGVFVDRWDARRAILWADALRALLILCLLPLPFATHRLPAPWQLGAIYGVVFLARICAQFFNPARLALTGDIVADEQGRARAAGLEQVTAGLAAIVGPAVAAPLFVALGAEVALAANALSFAASFLALLAIRAPHPAAGLVDIAEQGQAGHVWREFGQGARLYLTNRVLTVLLVSTVVVMLGAGALNALDYFFATDNLHMAPRLYGFLSAAFGVGALAGAILATLWAGHLGVARLFWLSILAAGALTMVYARLTSFAPALVVLFLMGPTNAAVNVAVGPLILHAAPRAYVGRVTAILLPAVDLASLISIGTAGAIVSTVLRGFHATLLGLSLGPIDTVFTATGLLMLAGGLYAMVNLRDITPVQP